MSKLHGTKTYDFRDGFRKPLRYDELVYSPELVPSLFKEGCAPGICSYIAATTSGGPRMRVEPVSMIAWVAKRNL